jgi:hypothetical protein
MTIEWNKVTWYSKLAAVIVFVGTFFLGFWLGTMNAEKVYIEIPHISRVTTTSSVPIIATPTEKFSDWKTYTDEKYGFQFKYPPFESASVDDSDASVRFVLFMNFAFDATSKPKEMTLDEWFSKTIDYNDLLIKTGVFKKIIHKGNPAFTMTVTQIPVSFLDERGPVYVTFYTESPSKDYILSFTMPPQDLPPEKMISSHGYDFSDWKVRFQEDILSTLTFPQ